MTAAPRPLVLVVERTVLGAWCVVEALAEVTVTLVEAREARRRRVRPAPGAALAAVTGSLGA